MMATGGGWGVADLGSGSPLGGEDVSIQKDKNKKK